jgi:hypothetical protein
VAKSEFTPVAGFWRWLRADWRRVWRPLAVLFGAVGVGVAFVYVLAFFVGLSSPITH